MAYSRTITIPIGRVSYPSVFYKNKYGKFQYDHIFEPGANLSQLDAIIDEAVEKQWGQNPPDNIVRPIHDGSAKKPGKPEYEGRKYISPRHGTQAPAVLGPKKDPITQESGRFYGGCWATAMVTAYTYGGPGTGNQAGVSIGLKAVQKVRDDEHLGAYDDPDEYFEEHSAEPGGDPETATLD